MTIIANSYYFLGSYACPLKSKRHPEFIEWVPPLTVSNPIREILSDNFSFYKNNLYYLGGLCQGVIFTQYCGWSS